MGSRTSGSGCPHPSSSQKICAATPPTEPCETRHWPERLMDKILHDLKYSKLWELCYIPYIMGNAGFCPSTESRWHTWQQLFMQALKMAGLSDIPAAMYSQTTRALSPRKGVLQALLPITALSSSFKRLLHLHYADPLHLPSRIP